MKWKQLLILTFSICVFLFSQKVQTPLFLKLRPWDSIAVIFISFISLFLLFKNSKKNFPIKKYWYFWLSISFFLLSAFIVIHRDISLRIAKQKVLNTKKEIISKLGKHFIIGYKNSKEVEPLIKTGAIGGLYITHYNVEGKSAQQVKQEISYFQKLRKDNNLPPLIISTDQEGGPVARMAAYLPKQPTLSEVIANNSIQPNRDIAVIDYAKAQGKGLKNLGINLNFAPVVDLQTDVRSFFDLYSQIHTRSISEHPQLVADVAWMYTVALHEQGVNATLKHFPGLGKVKGDTHISHPKLNSSWEELEKEELIPFRFITQKTNAWIMLSHVTLPKVDSTPVSFSKKIIQDKLRNEWKFNGILITDDFSMAPAFDPGIGKSSVKALNAGVDYILISFDTDQYYVAMNELLEEQKKGKIDEKMIERSEKRIAPILNKLKTQ